MYCCPQSNTQIVNPLMYRFISLKILSVSEKSINTKMNFKIKITMIVSALTIIFLNVNAYSQFYSVDPQYQNLSNFIKEEVILKKKIKKIITKLYYYRNNEIESILDSNNCDTTVSEFSSVGKLIHYYEPNSFTDESYVYDNQGRLVYLTGKYSQTKYNYLNNNLVEILTYRLDKDYTIVSHTGFVYKKNKKMKFIDGILKEISNYDERNNLIEQKDTNEICMDGCPNYLWSYDSLNRLIECQIKGNMFGCDFKYNYDNNRLVSIYVLFKKEYIDSISYSYDSKGDLTQVKCKRGQIEYRYDDYGNISIEIRRRVYKKYYEYFFY